MDLNKLTIYACITIVAMFVIAWWYVSAKNKEELLKNKKWIEQLPSMVSTLGVLGTFLGITIGLYNFNPSDLDNSIPLLLDGLKTAFMTSLLGMVGSMLLNRKVNHAFDKNENRESEIEKATGLITKAITESVNSFKTSYETKTADMKTSLTNAMENNTIKGIRQDIEQMKDDIEEIKARHEELKEISESILSELREIRSASGSCAEELPRLRAVALTATASISAIDNNIEDINGTVSNISDAVESINEKTENDSSSYDDDEDDDY